MKKQLLTTTIGTLVLAAALTGCGKTNAPQETPAPAAQETAAPIVQAAPSPAVPSAPQRQHGERYDTTIILEGMEETVHYEHVRNEGLGYEIDYDYESFTRRREADRELYISVWDSPEVPENYLEITSSADSAETAAAAISEELGRDYEVRQDSFELDRVGACIRIHADEIKGGGYMPEHLQTVFIIPAPDGCRIAWEHSFIAESEGFGHRFGYMMQTFSVLPR